jgi:4-hydroxy-tetrahydrodipicolinate synthase
MAEVKRAPRKHLVSGVVAAALTPLNADGSANPRLLADHCRRLLEAGCSSVVVLGTTGEANSFTLAERQALLESVIDAGVPAAALIVGTGCCAAGDSITLTRHALSLEIARVLMLPPFYYKAVSDDGLFAAFAQAIEGVADSRLRVYLYRIPQITGIDISVDLVERLHGAFPAMLAGIKDSTGAWETTRALCARLAGEIDVLVGNETLLRRALESGASGCVSATANANAAAIVGLLNAHSDADVAQRQRDIEATRATFEAFGIIPSLKAYLAETTGIETWANVRPPLRPLAKPVRAHMMSSLGPINTAT